MRKTISPALMPRRPQELRRIKIGGKGEKKQSQKGGTYREPVKYDHFLVTKRVRGEDDNYVTDEEFHSAIKDPQPRELKCRLMLPTPEENFRSSMVIYNGKKRVRTCDGVEYLEEGSGELRPCEYNAAQQCSCKPYGHLAVMLEGVGDYGAVAGYRTTSYESINNIQTALENYHRTFGTLVGIPFKLVLYEREVAKGTAWSVGVVIDASPEEARRVAQELVQLQAASRSVAALPPPPLAEIIAEIDHEEAGDIEEEFFPSTEDTGEAEVAGTGDQGGTTPESPQAPPPPDPGEKPAEDPGPAYSTRQAALRAALRADLTKAIGKDHDGIWEYLKAAKNVEGIESLSLAQLESLTDPVVFERVVAAFKTSPFYQEELPF